MEKKLITKIMKTTITKKSTGLIANRKIADLKTAVIFSINEWLSKVCQDHNIPSEIIEKQLGENICPLEAENWDYKNKWGYRLVIFSSSFSSDFKKLISDSLTGEWKEIIDLEHEQIIAGTEYEK